MTSPHNRLSIADRFVHLLTLISSERFLQKQGLGNEVPFFICPYDPKDMVEMENLASRLARALENRGIGVLEINLYDLAIELLRARGIFERILEMEPAVPKDRLKETLEGVLDPETHLVPAIAEKMRARAASASPFHVVFITGVGQVFPYIRSHNVLNNLQSTATEQPTVLFFPGTYTHSLESGASLDLFGKLHHDRYYRAFNIYSIGV